MAEEAVTGGEPALAERLGRLDPRLRAAFAAAVASRLLAMAHLDPPAAGVLWRRLLGEDVPAAELARLAAETEESIPAEDDADPWTPAVALTENALAALAYALRSAADDDLQSAVWAARQGTEAADALAAAEVEGTEFDADVERRIADHPLVRAERDAQERYLAYLEAPEPDLEQLRGR